MARVRLNYESAAEHFANAAALVPQHLAINRWEYRTEQAKALYALGIEFGANSALRQAVDVFKGLLSERPRAANSLGWALTQMNLGNALRTLGERESGTARLEEAVAAYHSALEEGTRERAPLQWALTQMSLGNALLALGEREGGRPAW